MLNKKYATIPLAEVEKIMEKRHNLFIHILAIFLLLLLPGSLLVIIRNL